MMRISGNNCALCVKHNTSYSCLEEHDGGCPLMKSLGKVCDDDNDSLFSKSLDEPELMVNALLKLLEKPA